jgi:hypothetical protein
MAMKSPLTPEQRTIAARNLYQNPILAELLAEIEQDFLNGWRASQLTTEREAFHAKTQALDFIRSRIDVTVRRELGDKRAAEPVNE